MELSPLKVDKQKNKYLLVFRKNIKDETIHTHVDKGANFNKILHSDCLKIFKIWSNIRNEIKKPNNNKSNC